jgi:K+-transporting ATPase A subunit
LGNPITLSGGITSGGDNNISLIITNSNTQTYTCATAGTYLYFLTNIVLGAHTATNAGSGNFILVGLISGHFIRLNGPWWAFFWRWLHIMAGVMWIGREW